MDDYSMPAMKTYYPDTPPGVGLGQMARMPTLKERLDLAVKQGEAKLAAAKEARDIFERNPDLERLLDLMQNNHF